MKTVKFVLRLCFAPLIATVIACMAWYLWLLEDYTRAQEEFNA
jgi:hypothetical protein